MFIISCPLFRKSQNRHWGCGKLIRGNELVGRMSPLRLCQGYFRNKCWHSCKPNEIIFWYPALCLN